MSGHFRPTPEQERTIALNEGVFLVKAPPGSGKTQVLTQRIVRLLRESAGQRFRILALTFTTKAAENMRSRIEGEVGSEWRRVTAQTFHAFCLDVLQHYGDAVGLSSDLTVYENEDDRVETLARGLMDEGIAIGRSEDDVKSLKRLLVGIGLLKRDLTPSMDVPAGQSNEGVPIEVAYAAYDRTLRLYNAVDFDDLLVLTYRLFSEQPRIARHYRRLFRYILVDEAQDTSRAQYEVLKALCGDEHRNVMLVSDGDQYIYRFAGASDRFLKAFVEDFGATQVSLTLNFRCAEAIVAVANSLIKHNRGRSAGSAMMQSEAQARGLVTAASYKDEEAEARGVVDFVGELLTQGMADEWLNPTDERTVKPEEICILARNRYHLKATLNELQQRNIAFQFGTSESGLFDSALFKAVYYALRVIANPRDLLSRRNLLGVLGPPEGSDAEMLGKPVTEFLDLSGPRSEETPGIIVAFMAERWASHSNGTALVQDLIARAPEICKLSQNEDVRALEAADLEIFQERWSTYRRHVESEEETLQGFLGEIALVKRTASDGPGVRVLTIHAAKGLEFAAVVLVGLNQGSFPDFRSLDSDAGISDERRNAYVAVTRAGRRLHLTRPRTRYTPWGSVKQQEPSRFLQEMGVAMGKT